MDDDGDEDEESGRRCDDQRARMAIPCASVEFLFLFFDGGPDRCLTRWCKRQKIRMVRGRV